MLQNCCLNENILKCQMIKFKQVSTPFQIQLYLNMDKFPMCKQLKTISMQLATENPLDGSIIAHIPSHKSLRVHLRFDLPFTNFHIDNDFEIILYVVKLIALNLCYKCMKWAILKACFYDLQQWICYDSIISTMRVNGFTTI